MIRLQYILITLLGGLAMLASTSCTTDKTVDIPDDPTPEEHWITLQFVMSGKPAVTRANPIGGETGNGREDGILNENDIHDVNIFIHSSTESLLNAALNTQLTHLYFNLDDENDEDNSLKFEKEVPETGSTSNGNETIIYTIKFKNPVDEPGNPLKDLSGSLRFITLANIGKTMKGTVKTLNELRNYTIEKTWTGTENNVEKYDRFVMTTAYDNTTSSGDSFLDLSPNRGFGSKDKPYFGSTLLERMCARIDVMYSEDNLTADKSELVYNVSDGNGTVHILNMQTVNVMSDPSYLFKKVTDKVPTNWGVDPYHTWGGEERIDANGVPLNYVIERHTLEKENLLEEGNQEVLKEWYGASRASVIEDDIKDEAKGKVSGYYHGDLPATELKKYTKMAILGYANENTQSQNQFNSKFLTGIAFRGVYQPASVYSAYTLGLDGKYNLTTAEPGNIPSGKFSVWQYSPSSAVEKQTEDGKTMSTEKAVKESRSLYFTNENALDAYQKQHPEDNAVVTEFPEGVITNDVEGNRYIGFVCYYNLWLRHYNDENADPQETYPMEYAIVRNNIYRVAISFNGPGDPTPTMREPDTMQSRIYVVKWNFRLQPEITM